MNVDGFNYQIPLPGVGFRYDDSKNTLYTKYLQHIGQSSGVGTRAVDVVIFNADTVWLVEVKDFRRGPRTKEIELVDEISMKVRDTIAAFYAMRQGIHASPPYTEYGRWGLSRELRVIFHLEHNARSKLFPKATLEADFQAALKKKLKPFTRKVHVTNAADMSALPGVFWTVV